jgi:hypothetical protein
MGSSRFWAGEAMPRKALSKPPGMMISSKRSRGERITKACGVSLEEKDAFPGCYLEGFLSYIHIELSFEQVVEFIFARMHVRRGFIARH